MQKKPTKQLFSINKITFIRCYAGRSVADLDHTVSQFLKKTKGAQKTEKIRTANQPTRESHASVPRNRLPPIGKSHLL